MLEAVRISRAAFPHRLIRETVMLRFLPLAASEGGQSAKVKIGQSGEAGLKALLEILLPTGGYCIGKTKVRKTRLAAQFNSVHLVLLAPRHPHLTSLHSPPPTSPLFRSSSRAPNCQPSRRVGSISA